MATQPISDPAHEGEMPDIRSRLRAVLEADLAANKLVVSSHSAIKRLHYARLLGCSPSRMSQIAEVFEEFEGRTSLVYVKPESNLAARLRAALEADAEIGAVRTSRGGKINRSHYARQFGYTSTALNGFGAIFSDFESRLNVVTGPMRHLADMRAWLQKAYAAGELGVRNGKIDRVEFAKRFKLRGGTFMSRHPEIRALIAEYDARVEQDGYLPAALAEDLERVRRALAAGPELNKDRMTINTVALSAASKVPQGRFRDRHFADAIAEVQAAIVANATASRIDPLVHGRVFPFSDLSSHWPVSFLERVGMRFKIFASTLASTAVKQPYLQLLAALRWIGASENPHCLSVVEHAAQRSIPAEPWEEALYAYRGHLMADIASGASSHTAVDSALTGLRSAIGFLAGGQVVPETSVPLAGVKYARRRTQPLRSVAEVGQGRQADYVAFARDRFTEACRMVGSEMDSGEADLFFQGLSSELAVVSALPADPSEAILAVLDRRLAALHDHARSIVDKAVGELTEGLELSHFADLDPAAFVRDYFGSAMSRFEKIDLLRANFPIPDKSSAEEARRSVANLLALINWQHAGVPPATVDKSGAVAGTGAFYGKRYREHGGIQDVERKLLPCADAVAAALVLYMIESGANVSVARTLDRLCLEKSDLPDHHRIFGHKARAKGKPIIVDLPDASPAVSAIRWLIEAGKPLAAQAGEQSDSLFLMHIGSRVKLMEAHWLTNWFKPFASSAIGVSDLVMTPNMIRPSVLLQAALSNDGRLAAGIALGQHGAQVSQGYQQKHPTRLLYDENIRRFQTAFEVLVMSGVDDAAARLGISVDQFENRLGQLRATGLGTFCKDSRGRPGVQSSRCTTMDCWNDCPNLLIVAEVEAIAQLQLWQSSLREVQPEWERDRPERWDQVWLPWLCLADVIQEKMARGSLSTIWKRAAARSDAIKSEPNFRPPRPW